MNKEALFTPAEVEEVVTDTDFALLKKADLPPEVPPPVVDAPPAAPPSPPSAPKVTDS